MSDSTVNRNNSRNLNHSNIPILHTTVGIDLVSCQNLCPNHLYNYLIYIQKICSNHHCSELVNKREAKSLSQPLASEALHFGYSFLHLLFTCVNVSRVPGTRLFWEEHVFEDGVVSFTATLCTNTKLQIHQVHSLIHQVVNCVPVVMKGSEVTYQRGCNFGYIILPI